MKCPICEQPDSKVIDSRPVDDDASIRRRRECVVCHHRFTTFETMDTMPVMVLKKDGTTELFDRNKILASVMKACDKRKVSHAAQEALVTDIEQELQNGLYTELTTRKIGEMVMARLKDFDEVAYIRFASVYRKFADISSFLEELKELQAHKSEESQKEKTGKS